MRERITEIIGLIMIFTGLFGICMILTSCEEDGPVALGNGSEESEETVLPKGYTFNGDGTISPLKNRDIKITRDIIGHDYNSSWDITIVGYTDKTKPMNDWKNCKFSDTKKLIEEEIEKMIEKEAPGANYEYLYNEKRIEVNNGGRVTYYITWE